MGRDSVEESLRKQRKENHMNKNEEGSKREKSGRRTRDELE